ncbi:CSS-motif domain-containing protein [Sphingomonas piscis]|nr:CSS-motif domain-containing protein [Sphingomonas piscis]
MLVRQQTAARDETVAQGLARSALLSAERSGAQLYAAATSINRMTQAQACSRAGLQNMREIDLGSTLLQGVGWAEGNTLRCSSFGATDPIELGPANFVSTTGSIFRTRVKLSDPDLNYVIVQTGSSVGVIHKDLALSFVENVPGLAVGVFSWSTSEPIISRGEVDPKFLRLGGGGDAIFRDEGHTVAIVRSGKHDIGAVAVLPAAHSANFAAQAARILIPTGVLVGLLLSTFLVRYARARASLPMLIRAALKRREFYLVYQPIVELVSGKMVGVEALIRWDRGMHSRSRPTVSYRLLKKLVLFLKLPRVCLSFSSKMPSTS